MLESIPSRISSQVAQDRYMASLDWSMVSQQSLKAAVAEMDRRRQLSEALLQEHDFDAKELTRKAQGAPVVFPAQKHALHMAAEKAQEIGTSHNL